MSAYFRKILWELHRQTKEELAQRGIEIPRRGLRELKRINQELRKEVLDDRKGK